MKFKEDAPVYGADGERVGSVDRVVIDPKTRAVTHVVVKEGLFFSREKVVPVGLIAEASDKEVTLSKVAADIQALRDFEEKHYVPADSDPTRTPPSVRSLFLYPPRSVTWWGPAEVLDSPARSTQRRYVSRRDESIRRDQVALKEGARVFDKDGHHVGDVAEIVTEPQSDLISHISISRGVLLKRETLIPSNWVQEFGQEEIRLSVGSEYLQNLKAPKPEE